MPLAEGPHTRYLAETDWQNWRPEPIGGDASSRAYWRLHGPNEDKVILMDNGSPDGNGFPEFRRIADHLRKIGLVSPEILHLSTDRRFAVISDLGQTTLASHIDAAPDEAPEAYAALTGVLDILARHPPPDGLIRMTPALASDMLAPLFEHALPNLPAECRLEIRQCIHDTIDRLCGPAETLSLRDCHAENVIWRSDALGTDRFGLLDFQDALLTPEEYDLASLLRDVRRDLSEETRERCLRSYAESRGKSRVEVGAACAILAVQRNMRIVGIFTRLIREEGKTRYGAFMPRTRRLIHEDLRHPELSKLRATLEPALKDLPI